MVVVRYLGPGSAVFRLFRLGVPGSLVDIRNTPQRGRGSLIPICSRDLAASPHYHQYSDPQRLRLSCSSCTIARPGLISVSLGVIAQDKEKEEVMSSLQKLVVAV